MDRNYLYYIYKTTCLITNKYYIGMHKTYKHNDGYTGSGLLLKRSIKKHGVENHSFEILEYCDNLEHLCQREEQIVNENLLKDELCMNLKLGGVGGATMTGRKQNQETIEKIRKANTGKKRSDKYKEENAIRMSEIWKGNQYAKGNKHWVGRKHSEESLVLMRDNHPFRKLKCTTLMVILFKSLIH